jgi:hypothetical protein
MASAEVFGGADDPQRLGLELAQKLRGQGADEILAALAGHRP